MPPQLLPFALFATLSTGVTFGPVIAPVMALAESNSLRANPVSRTVEQQSLQSEAESLYRQGSDRYRASQWSAALESWERALEIYHELGDRTREAKILGHIGVTYKNLGNYQKALVYYNRGLMLNRELHDKASEAGTLSNLGTVHDLLGNFSRALSYYQKSLAIASNLADTTSEARALGNIGIVYKKLGNYSEALRYDQKSLALFIKLNDPVSEARILNNLGEVYRLLRHYDQAMNYYKQSLTIKRTLGDRPGEAATLGNIGNLHLLMNHTEQALAVYQKSLEIKHRIGDRSGEATTLGNIGNIYQKLGRYNESLSFYQQSLSLFQDLGDRASEADILSNLGLLHQIQGQTILAILFFKQAINQYESIRIDNQALSANLQLSYTETVADTYRHLADLLLQQDRVIEAQQVLDLLKVQEIDHYRRGIRGSTQQVRGLEFLRSEDNILTSLGELQKSAIAAGRELANLQQLDPNQLTPEQKTCIAQLDNLLTKIKADFNEFSRRPDISALVAQLSREARDASLSLGTLDSLRDELKQLNAAIVYPLVLEDRLELVITTPDAPPLRRTVKISRSQLNQAILNFRQALTNSTSTITPSAQQLYNWLIRPILSDLTQSGVDTIIYAPDSQLRYIPLAALYDGKNWLIQRYRIHNIIAQSLTNITKTDTRKPKILAAAYADPTLIYTPTVDGRTYTFSGLPGAGEEVSSLPATTRYLDRNFSLATLKPKFQHYNILHFATHAAFVSGKPEDSFILFGDGETPTLRDVESWSLNSIGLVVLSACETGIGGLGNGEEILGLGYQFQVSGAKSVMASLWKVSDLGTQQLMVAFYNALNQDMSKAAALQEAQKALINEENGQFQHPYYWAPFILIGNGL